MAVASVEGTGSKISECLSALSTILRGCFSVARKARWRLGSFILGYTGQHGTKGKGKS